MLEAKPPGKWSGSAAVLRMERGRLGVADAALFAQGWGGRRVRVAQQRIEFRQPRIPPTQVSGLLWHKVTPTDSCPVAVAARREAEGKALEACLGPALSFIRTDVSIDADVRAMSPMRSNGSDVSTAW